MVHGRAARTTPFSDRGPPESALTIHNMQVRLGATAGGAGIWPAAGVYACVPGWGALGAASQLVGVPAPPPPGPCISPGRVRAPPRPRSWSQSKRPGPTFKNVRHCNSTRHAAPSTRTTLLPKRILRSRSPDPPACNCTAARSQWPPSRSTSRASTRPRRRPCGRVEARLWSARRVTCRGHGLDPCSCRHTHRPVCTCAHTDRRSAGEGSPGAHALTQPAPALHAPLLAQGQRAGGGGRLAAEPDGVQTPRRLHRPHQGGGQHRRQRGRGRRRRAGSPALPPGRCDCITRRGKPSVIRPFFRACFASRGEAPSAPCRVPRAGRLWPLHPGHGSQTLPPPLQPRTVPAAWRAG